MFRGAVRVLAGPLAVMLARTAAATLQAQLLAAARLHPCSTPVLQSAVCWVGGHTPPHRAQCRAPTRRLWASCPALQRSCPGLAARCGREVQLGQQVSRRQSPAGSLSIVLSAELLGRCCCKNRRNTHLQAAGMPLLACRHCTPQALHQARLGGRTAAIAPQAVRQRRQQLAQQAAQSAACRAEHLRSTLGENPCPAQVGNDPCLMSSYEGW